MGDILNAALEYAQRGWAVFPLHGIKADGECNCGTIGCSDKGKHPLNRRGLKEASKDLTKIAEMFKGDSVGPDEEGYVAINVGIVTGEISGITVIDVDIGPEKVGDITWAELTKEHGEPDTLMARTGSGGMHVFFQYNSALNTSSNTLGKGVDCRNDGGYVVGAPSPHRSGRRYEWLNEGTALAPLPAHMSKRKETRGRKKKDDPTRKKFTIEEVIVMLSHVPPDDRDMWRKVGIILGREFARNEVAWQAYVDWAAGWKGKPGRGHEQIMHEAFHELSQEPGDLSIGTIIAAAIAGGWAPTTGQVPAEKFLYYAPGNNFIYRSTGAFWPGESVDASCSPVNENGVIVRPSIWLKKNRLVTSMTKDPILENEVTKGWDCLSGALIEAEGAALFNSYREPTIKLGDSRLAAPYVDHVRRVFNKPGDADMFLDYMAHRVQYPGIKARFSLIIAGQQGVGKDTAISMCYPAIGSWNIANIEPAHLDQGFNEFASQVLVVVSEAANTNEMSKFILNERLKNLIAGLPDEITINPKYGQKFSVRMHNGTIITTNHLATGIYIPPDDRRYDVIDSATKLEMGFEGEDGPRTRAEYFGALWEWYLQMNGASHIAAFLHERDLSGFNAASGQRITAAHKVVVASGLNGDDWLVDALDALGDPKMVRADVLYEVVESLSPGDVSKKEFNFKVGHALGRSGFVRLNNGESVDGRWKAMHTDGLRRTISVYYHPERIKPTELQHALNEILKAGAKKF